MEINAETLSRSPCKALMAGITTKLLEIFIKVSFSITVSKCRMLDLTYQIQRLIKSDQIAQHFKSYPSVDK